MAGAIVKVLSGWMPSFGPSESIACMPGYSGTQSSSKTTNQNLLGKLELTITDERVKELMNETCNIPAKPVVVNTATKPVGDNACILCFLEHKEKYHHDTLKKIEYGVVEPILSIPVCVAHKEEDDTVNAYCWGLERKDWDDFVAKAANIVKTKEN